ncbi:MAG: uroporphyrinogen decarboxylase family protein [Acetivibrionales bacterium]
MTFKEQILAAVRGEPLPCLPFVPRLDLWYNGNKATNSLPDKYKNATLTEIVDDLGLGYHCVVPDFSAIEDDMDAADVGLGIFRTKSILYTVELNVEKKVNKNNGETETIYITPYGELKTKTVYTDDMKLQGITQPQITEPAVKTEADYAKVGYIFENATVKPRYHYYDAIHELVGERGPIVAFHYEGGSPMHILQKEMVGFENFWYHLHDNPEVMLECAEKIEDFMIKVLEVVVKSPGEIIYSGANFDAMTTNPKFFKEHITPFLKRRASIIHENGKYLLAHTDGENKGLLQEYIEADVDICDSVCPAPMTELSLQEYRDILKDKSTIWGGIASVSTLPDSMSDYDFEKYIDSTLESIGSGRNIILSIADCTPPGAKFDRILTIIKKVKEFGPVK